MNRKLVWDETKRHANLAKHGLDFADAGEVLESRFRLDIPVMRGGEARTLSISYALTFLAVLTVVHTEREDTVRVISFRRASLNEREANGRPTMSGSKTNAMNREAVREAVRKLSPEHDFVWDGDDEDDRPATEDELSAAVPSYRERRGRPPGSDKTLISLRVDNDTLAAFRATGKGWQSRMNEALREWLTRHSSNR